MSAREHNEEPSGFFECGGVVSGALAAVARPGGELVPQGPRASPLQLGIDQGDAEPGRVLDIGGILRERVHADTGLVLELRPARCVLALLRW